MMEISNPLAIEELPREEKIQCYLLADCLLRKDFLIFSKYENSRKSSSKWELQIVGDGAERVSAEKMGQYLGL